MVDAMMVHRSDVSTERIAQLESGVDIYYHHDRYHLWAIDVATMDACCWSLLNNFKLIYLAIT